MITFFKVFLYEPIYNSFVMLVNLLPWFDVGVIVIIFTSIIKLILAPLSKKAIEAQITMKKIEPELALIKSKHKNDKQKQAEEMMNFYKKNKINPFSSIFVLIIQIPIIYSLYYLFLRSGLPKIDTTILYSFIDVPLRINMNFLGLIDISQKSLLLALAAALSSFIQMRMTSKRTEGLIKSNENSFKNNLSKMMSTQMKYFFPVIVFFISYSISGVVALYWATSNVGSIVQEFFIYKKSEKKEKSPTVNN